MARRTIAELRSDINALLPTNGVAGITASDVRTVIRNVTDTISPGYCALFLSTPAVRQFSESVWAKLDIYDGELLPRDSMFSYANGEVTISHAGVVRVTISATFEAGTNVELFFALGINGARSIYETEIQGRGTSKPAAVGLPNCVHDVIAGDVLSVLCSAESGTNKQASFNNGVFIVEYVPTIGTGVA